VAERAFADPPVRAIGGPGVTPPGSGWRAAAGGAVYESPLGSGPLNYRFRPGAPRVVDDYPAYNLIVRREAVESAGGWASTFYGGEDTRFCEALAAQGARVHYVPELLVYHHRRPILRAHMRQIANVGRHRGHFARAAGSSRRLVYFLPAVAALAMPLLALAALAKLGPRRGLAAGGAAYGALAAASPLPGAAVRLAFPLALMAHHASYGTAFIAGLATRRMDR
jgi:GT2 family glycosyltransferase